MLKMQLKFGGMIHTDRSISVAGDIMVSCKVRTVQAIRYITLHKFVRIFSKFYQKLQISCIKFTYEFGYEFVHEIQKKARSRNFRNSCTNFEK